MAPPGDAVRAAREGMGFRRNRRIDARRLPPSSASVPRATVIVSAFDSHTAPRSFYEKRDSATGLRGWAGGFSAHSVVIHDVGKVFHRSAALSPPPSDALSDATDAMAHLRLFRPFLAGCILSPASFTVRSAS